jgi:predicted DNA-binding transcriptional regulator AlpA
MAKATSNSTPAEAFSIAEFCAAHRISRTTYYNLVESGLAPTQMNIGRRRLISREAAEKWRARMERNSNALKAA